MSIFYLTGFLLGLRMYYRILKRNGFDEEESIALSIIFSIFWPISVIIYTAYLFMRIQ